MPAKKSWRRRRGIGRGMHEPVLPVVGKQIVTFKYALIGAAVVGDHQVPARPEIGPQDSASGSASAAIYLKVQFIAAPDVECWRLSRPGDRAEGWISVEKSQVSSIPQPSRPLIEQRHQRRGQRQPQHHQDATLRNSGPICHRSGSPSGHALGGGPYSIC